MASISTFLTELLLGKRTDSQVNLEQKHMKVNPDKNSQHPDHAWSAMKKSRKVKIVKPLEYKTPRKPDHVRFVCISDTHTKLEASGTLAIPDGDVLLHAGDLTMFGKPDEVHLVNEYLGKLPHKHKVVIAGNHDMTFDLEFLRGKASWRKYWNLNQEENARQLHKYGAKTVHEMMTNCIYLQDSMVELYGIKIFGSPWSTGSSDSWGFQARRGPPIMAKWDKIPDDTDILITHGPPVGYGDDLRAATSKFTQLKSLITMESHVGCVDLLNTVQQRVKPRYHIYGHIHEGYGVSTDGTTTFINAAVCTESYRPINPPIIFDLPVPEGYTKDMSDPVKWIIPTDIGKLDEAGGEENDEFEIVFTHDKSIINKHISIASLRQSSDLKQISHQAERDVDSGERNDCVGGNVNKQVSPKVKPPTYSRTEKKDKRETLEQRHRNNQRSPTKERDRKSRVNMRANRQKKQKDSENVLELHANPATDSEVKDITNLCSGLSISVDNDLGARMEITDATTSAKLDEIDDASDDFGDIDFPCDNSDVANIWNKWVYSESDSDKSDGDDDDGDDDDIIKIEKDDFQIISKNDIKK